ncbi:MAG: L,D-transpeptidase [Coriobacteriia bacterium]|nr:L,D-transpeptidase [Coriobacteriia bacterium]
MVRKHRSLTICGLIAASALMWVATVGSAHALVVTAAPDATATTDVSVLVEAVDGSGTVTLLRDGVAVGEMPASPGTVVFVGAPLKAGRQVFGARLNGTGGAVNARIVAAVFSWGTPCAPTWIAPVGGYAAKLSTPRVTAGSSTASMTLLVNGRVVASALCTPGVSVKFPRVALPKGVSTFTIVAANRFGTTATYSVKVRRLDYPAPTCIIIDKSDYRLYWIRNGELVKAYRIAHGKHNCTPVGTWKILAKYRTNPKSVYGPRKMRMFRKVGRRYVFTPYAIHGTNQEWVIGTQASHGCIRMYNRDVLKLWPQVPIGTLVITRP